MTVIEILEKLESDNSRLFKEDVLEQNKNNDLLKRVLIASLDPYVNYGVAKFKLQKPVSNCDQDAQLEIYLSLLHDLSERKLTGNAAKHSVETFMQNCDELTQKWCKRILLKNLRCGVQAITVNKVWSDLVKGFSVSLAATLETLIDDNKVTIKKSIKYPLWSDPKLDGMRCVIVKKHGEVSMFSRNGKPITTLKIIEKAIEKCDNDNFVLDGEALARNKSWEDSVSIVNSRVYNKNDKDLIFHVFDSMSIDEWEKQRSVIPLSERNKFTKNLINEINHENVQFINGKIINNKDELVSYFFEMIDQGYEGVMLKDLDAVYEFKRSDAVLKFKPTTTHEGVVIGYYNGRDNTRFTDVIRGFNVVFPNNVVTNVATGFKDEFLAEAQLDLFAKTQPNKSKYIGRIMEVKGQFLTPDGKVRFPRFIRWRDVGDVDESVIAAGEKAGVEVI